MSGALVQTAGKQHVGRGGPLPHGPRASLSPQGLSRRVAGHLTWQFKAPKSAKAEAASAMFHFCYIPLIKLGHRPGRFIVGGSEREYDSLGPSLEMNSYNI